MRAVQRKVFPNGAGGYVQPEITAPQTQAQAPGVPASSALTDLTSRVTSLEEQMANLTGQIEQNGYRTRQLQDQFDAYKRTTEARLKALEAGPAPIAPAGQSAPLDTPAPAASGSTRPTKTPAAASVVTGDTASTEPAAGGAAVEKPSTGDAAEDAYLYGYRLWAAKRYPEAEAQLKKVVADYPKSRRASFAQNLLGPHLSGLGQTQPRLDGLLRELQEIPGWRARARQSSLSRPGADPAQQARRCLQGL